MPAIRAMNTQKKLGFTPDLIIGDFDSCKIAPEEDLLKENASAKIIRLPTDKDDSDTMAGIKKGIEQGCTDFTLICAAGGRFDHFFCNIQTLSYIAERFGKAALISETEEITVIKNTFVEIPRREGWTLSVFSLCDKSLGVTEKGTRWQLNGEVMQQNAPYGLSNEWAAETATIGVEEGTLIIILSKEK